MVLTAGHCDLDESISVDIGRYDRVSLTQQYENIAVEQKLRNPLFVAGDAIRHDQLLLKLSSTSTVTPIKINFDPDIPGLNVDVTVVGWGLTDGSNDGSASSVLKETIIQTISNSECSMSSNPSFPWTNYQGLIFDDMLCAYSFGTDSCQGDSGGPLIMSTSEGDLQVGIVSWGFGCAQQYFPGVYSRTSYDANWLVSTVCQNSISPPAYFNCTSSGSSNTSDVTTPSPTPSQTLPVSSTSITVTVQIQMDSYPKDIGWRLELIGDTIEIVAQRTPGVYTTPNELVEESLSLQEGEIYAFIIFDISSDGLCCLFGSGSYQLILGDRIIISGDGKFKEGTDHTFLATLDDTPVSAPVSPGSLSLELQIQFDSFPEETGWILRADEPLDNTTRVNDQIIAFKPSGSYSNVGSSQFVTESIALPSEGKYTFYFLDAFADGICCSYGNGYYRLYEIIGGKKNLLVQGTGGGSNREITNFEIGESSLEQNNSVPTVSPSPTSSGSSVFVSILPDMKPDEIGWSIQDEKGKVVASKPVGSYTSLTRVDETILVESDAVYTFIISDEAADGLCCDFGQGAYGVETTNGIVGIGYEFGSSESIVFASPGTFPVTLKIQTDSYPEEIGWYLERLDLDETVSISMIPYGFYTISNELIEREMMVTDGGFYRFTIFDSNLDGICCTDAQGSISLIIGDDKRIVSSEPGNYSSGATFNFLGSSTNSLPNISNPRNLTLSLTFDRYPNDVSWLLLQSEDDSSVSREVHRNNMQIVAFGPSGRAYYPNSLATKTITETIQIEAVPQGIERSFNFIFLDVSGDGLCCEYGAGTYTLYYGEGSGNNSSSPKVLASGNAQGQARVTHTFTMSSDGTVSTPIRPDATASSAISSVSSLLSVIVTALVLSIF